MPMDEPVPGSLDTGAQVHLPGGSLQHVAGAGVVAGMVWAGAAAKHASQAQRGTQWFRAMGRGEKA